MQRSPLEEELIDAVRLFQRLLEGAGRRRVELQRRVSAFEIHINQRDPTLSLLASCQAVLTAIVVAPTPPRTPSTKTSFPPREGADLSSCPPLRMLLTTRLIRSRAIGLKKYSATPAFLSCL